MGSSGAAAVSGYADITVPTGYDHGLPIGITFIGGRWAEPSLLGASPHLLAVAHAEPGQIETVTPAPDSRARR